MKSNFSILFICFLSLTANAQLSFSDIIEPTLGYHYDNWEFMSDGNGQYYLKRWDDFLNQQYNIHLVHSGDGGAHWSIVSSKAGRRHFIGMDGKVYVLEGQSLQRSDDFGHHFDTIALGISSAKSLVVTENGEMYHSNNLGIYYSDNQGLDWTKVSDAANLTLKNLPDRPDVWGWTVWNNVFHLWHSPGPGQNWTEIYSTPYSYYQSIHNNLVASPDGMIYFAVGTDFNRILRSADGGLSWEEKKVDPNAPSEFVSFAAFPSGELLARLNNNKWYHSTDQGLSFQEYHPSWEGLFKHALSTPEGELFASGSTILSKYATNDAWNFSAFGLVIPHQISWPDTATIQLLTTGGILSIDNTATTFTIPVDLPATVGCAQVYLGTSGGYYTKQCNNTLTFTPDYGQHNDTIFTESDQANIPEDISKFQQNGDTLRILTQHYLYSSYNAGQTWSHSEPISGFHSWREIMVASSGRVYPYDEGTIYRSDDGGSSYLPTGPAECCFWSLQGLGDDHIFAMHDEEMWVSSDHAASWQTFGTDPLNGNWQFLVNEISNYQVMPDFSIFAGGLWNGVGSVFYSPDYGQTWNIFSLGQGNCSIAGVGRDGYLYVSLRSHSAIPYRLLRSEQKVSALVSTQEQELNSGDLKLFPNPATGVLNFGISIEDGFTTDIFNQLGELMYHRTNMKVADRLEIASLPEGTYFIKISNKTNVWHGKFIKVGQ